MSIQLVTTDHYEKLQIILDSTETEIRIISPFIKDETANLLCAILENNPKIKCSIITRFVRTEFAERVSSLQALKKLRLKNAQIYALRYLHSKLYLVDTNIVMMGSANFTTGGFRLNHELSVLIEDEPILCSEMQNYFNNLISEIEPQSEGIVELDTINKEIAMLENNMKGWNRKDIKYSFDPEYQYGATVKNIPKDKMQPSTDDIQEIFKQSVPYLNSERIWLKFEGTAEFREDPNDKYTLCTPAGYPEGFTSFPKSIRPVGIKNGDRIFIAVVTQDNKDQNTPVIIGRCTSYGYEPNNVATPDMIMIYDWMERYPNFIRLKDVEYLLSDLKDGISLIDVLINVGTDTYPTTLDTSKALSEIRTIHYQKSHLKITSKAASFINERFEELAKIHGTNLKPIP